MEFTVQNNNNNNNNNNKVALRRYAQSHSFHPVKKMKFSVAKNVFFFVLFIYTDEFVLTISWILLLTFIYDSALGLEQAETLIV